jgi:hypothetical protein
MNLGLNHIRFMSLRPPAAHKAWIPWKGVAFHGASSRFPAQKFARNIETASMCVHMSVKNMVSGKGAPKSIRRGKI